MIDVAAPSTCIPFKTFCKRFFVGALGIVVVYFAIYVAFVVSFR